jgi:excisionase family DNA binding protein
VNTLSPLQHSDGLTRAELLALPVTVDVTTAARALGLGRSTAYELARRGEFPCRVLHIGSSYRIPTADLLRVLGIEPLISGQRLAPPPAA